MSQALAVVLPVFGLIGLGWLARRTGYVTDRTGEGLSDFVFVYDGKELFGLHSVFEPPGNRFYLFKVVLNK